MKELTEKVTFTSQEQMYLEDEAIFQKAFLEKNLGRPQFEGKVQSGNVDATNFWINHIPKVINNYSFKQTVAVFSYLSDLSYSELRGRSFNGLTTGHDEDIHILRKALLEKMLSFQSPSQQKEWSQERYMYHFDNLFTECVGFTKTESFRKKNGDNNQSSPEQNPYLRINPDIKFKGMQEIIKHTLKEFNLLPHKSQTSFSRFTDKYIKKKGHVECIKEYQQEFERLINQDILLEPLRRYIPGMIEDGMHAVKTIQTHFASKGTTVSPERIKNIFTQQFTKKYINAPSFPIQGTDGKTEHLKQQLESAFLTLCDIELMKDTPNDIDLQQVPSK